MFSSYIELSSKVKLQSKEPPKWVGTFLNCNFVCLKNHKGSIIVWIAIKFFGIISINCKVYMLKVWHKLIMFLHVQSTQTSKMDNPYFFKCPFFLPNVHHFFWKLERILTLIIRREKGLEVMKIIFITNLSTFGSKVFFTLKIMDFESVVLTKVVHIYVIEGMNA